MLLQSCPILFREAFWQDFYRFLSPVQVECLTIQHLELLTEPCTGISRDNEEKAWCGPPKLEVGEHLDNVVHADDNGDDLLGVQDAPHVELNPISSHCQQNGRLFKVAEETNFSSTKE